MRINKFVRGTGITVGVLVGSATAAAAVGGGVFTTSPNEPVRPAVTTTVKVEPTRTATPTTTATPVTRPVTTEPTVTIEPPTPVDTPTTTAPKPETPTAAVLHLDCHAWTHRQLRMDRRAPCRRHPFHAAAQHSR